MLHLWSIQTAPGLKNQTEDASPTPDDLDHQRIILNEIFYAGLH